MTEAILTMLNNILWLKIGWDLCWCRTAVRAQLLEFVQLLSGERIG